MPVALRLPGDFAAIVFKIQKIFQKYWAEILYMLSRAQQASVISLEKLLFTIQSEEMGKKWLLMSKRQH